MDRSSRIRIALIVAVGLTLRVTPSLAAPTVRAYVTNTDANTISVIDVGTDSVIATIPLTKASNVDADPAGKFVYVATSSGNIARIDPRTNLITKTITLGASTRPFSDVGVEIAPNSKRAYAAHFGLNKVFAIDPATDAVVASRASTNAWGLAVLPDSSRWYVGNTTPINTLTVFSASTDTLLATVKVGSNPCQPKVSPDGKRVWIGNYSGATISVIDTTTNAIVGTVTGVKGPLDFRFKKDGSRVYVSANIGNAIKVYNPTTLALLATISVTAPEGIELSPDGTKLYVAANSLNQILVVSTATNTVTKSIAVGKGPQDVSMLTLAPVTKQVSLVSFSAARVGDGVRLTWQTGSEANCAAFRVLRCAADDCEARGYEALAGTPATPCRDSLVGARYQLVDPQASPTATYHYLLREHETHGGINHYGPLVLPANRASGTWNGDGPPVAKPSLGARLSRGCAVGQAPGDGGRRPMLALVLCLFLVCRPRAGR